MKKLFSLLLCAALLTGCSNTAAIGSPAPEAVLSQSDTVTEITLSDEGISVNGGQETAAVFTTNDIIYYEDKDTYASGNPYGEGEEWQRHTAEEAAAHTVVNITQPGTYRVTGKLSAGQIRVDLGEDSYYDKNAVVELILQNADITCTVAPAILFRNTYECDSNWSTETAKPDVDTSAAGANLILEGSNTVTGSHVAKIFKDKEGEKKLWKQDGAIYSYMSMNVYGSGSLDLTADNEGLDTELHLTINDGNITINSDNDGINTNEDGVSVTTINGGNLTIFAGLGAEGDGIDSNGYLVINGGNVLACAKPISDAGLDSDMGSFIHGGTVVAMGSAMDWAESDSGQVTVNLQFAQHQKAGSEIRIVREDGTRIFNFIPTGGTFRDFSGLIISDPALKQGDTYQVFINDVQMAYTGTDVMRGPGGFGGRPGDMSGGFDPENMPEGMPEDFGPGQMPGGFDPENMPEDFDPSRIGKRPEGEGRVPPEGFDPQNIPEASFGGPGQAGELSGEKSTGFHMNDMVNFFSGVTAAQ